MNTLRGEKKTGCWLVICPHKRSPFLVGFSGMWLENWCWETEAAVWLMYIRKVENEIGRNGNTTSAQHSTSTRDHSNIWSWQLTAPVDRGYRTAHLVHDACTHAHTHTRPCNETVIHLLPQESLLYFSNGSELPEHDLLHSSHHSTHQMSYFNKAEWQQIIWFKVHELWIWVLIVTLLSIEKCCSIYILPTKIFLIGMKYIKCVCAR